jgi:hypothetical protein
MGPLLFTRILRAAQQPMPKTLAKIILDGSGTELKFDSSRIKPCRKLPDALVVLSPKYT